MGKSHVTAHLSRPPVGRSLVRNAPEVGEAPVMQRLGTGLACVAASGREQIINPTEGASAVGTLVGSIGLGRGAFTPASVSLVVARGDWEAKPGAR